ncbi:hypothetical protein OTU49_015285, partial [Cherax quadricarinatus]
AEFDAHVRSTVESVMRTPEHDRPPTPLPDILPNQMEDTWMNESPPTPVLKLQEPVVSPKKKSPTKSKQIPKKADSPASTPLKKPTKSPIAAEKKAKTKKPKERRKEVEKVKKPPDTVSHDSGSETDTADEKSDLDDGMGESAEAAEALMALAGGDVNGR